ncbi:hypothetical protein B0H14DRAFT_2586783 [Mycena olivaceomarginata]|nr:hypothetical protein B0H14DRAFT_2586783 [Mycena olivaceomarginata]
MATLSTRCAMNTRTGGTSQAPFKTIPCFGELPVLSWGGLVRLCKTASITPISATTRFDTRDIRVYFQDQKYYLARVCRIFRRRLDVRDVLIPLDQILGSMAVVLWPGPEIRASHEAAGCESGEFRATAIPNADIAAFWHNSRNGYFIHVFRTSYEKILLNEDPTPSWFGHRHLPAIQEPDRLPVLMRESGWLDFGHDFYRQRHGYRQ